MSKLIQNFKSGDKSQKDLLGGKGANLAEMVQIGLPVPPGFTITTDACRHYLLNGEFPANLLTELFDFLEKLEVETGKKFGDSTNPLLVSVRSGAKFSMPGMMETVLNVGITYEVAESMANTSANPRFAWDSYRRFIEMFGKTVCEVPVSDFHHVEERIMAKTGHKDLQSLEVEDIKSLADGFVKLIELTTGEEFPTDPKVHLVRAIEAVFKSWNSERAQMYRRRERIPSDIGTAVNVQSMVFGNLSDDSGTGVAFTRNPATGENGRYGDYLQRAQGEDVVAGIRTPLTLEDFANLAPNLASELDSVMQS